MHRYLACKLTVSIFLFMLISGCNPMTKTAIPNLQNSPTPSRSGFRVVAYVTGAAVASTIPYEKLTHINYAFLLPNEDGTFQELVNTWLIGQLVSLAHKQNVKVLISVGGWGLDQQFEKMAADPGTRAAFVQNLVKIVLQYQFDGADIDWEYPDAGPSSQNFLTLMQEVRAALPKTSLLTAAVVALGEHGAGIPSEFVRLNGFCQYHGV